LSHYYKCTKLTFDWCHDFWCFVYRITTVLLSTSNLIMIIDFSAVLSKRLWDFHFIYEYTMKIPNCTVLKGRRSRSLSEMCRIYDRNRDLLDRTIIDKIFKRDERYAYSETTALQASSIKASWSRSTAVFNGDLVVSQTSILRALTERIMWHTDGFILPGRQLVILVKNWLLYFIYLCWFFIYLCFYFLSAMYLVNKVVCEKSIT